MFFTHFFRLPWERIENLKFANKTFLYFLSATFVQKNMRILGISESSTVNDLHSQFRLPCDREIKIRKQNLSANVFLSATFLQKPYAIFVNISFHR